MPQSEKMNAEKMTEKKGITPPTEPRVVRLGFTKHGGIIFTSHLDLQRTMMRILARADLPLWFTQGFNPHAKLVFGLPLPLGCASECELMDIRLENDSAMSCDEVLFRMRGATVPGLEFISCYPAAVKFADIASADYTITLRLPGVGAVTDREVGDMLAEPSIVTKKKTKSGIVEADIAPLIHSSHVTREAGALKIDVRLAAGAVDNLSPELLVKVILERFGVRAKSSSMGADYLIVRSAVYNTRGELFK